MGQTTEHKLVYYVGVDEASAKAAIDSHEKIGKAAVAAQVETDTASKESARQQKLIAKQREQAERELAGEIKRGQLEAARAAKEAAVEQEKAAREAARAAAAQDRSSRERELALQRVAAANQLLLNKSREATASLQADLAAEKAGAEASRARAAAKEIESRIVQASIDPESRLAAVLRQDLQIQQQLRNEIAATTRARQQADAVRDAVTKERDETVAIERKVAARRISIAALHAEEAAQAAKAQAQRLGISLDSAEGRELLDLARRRQQANAALAGHTAAASASVSASQRLVGVLGQMGFVVGGAAIAGLALRRLSTELREAVTAYAEAEGQQRLLEQALNTGAGAARFNAAELGELADAMAFLAGVDDDLVISAEKVLLSFSRIGREIFPEVLERAADISAKFGGDLVTNAEGLGRALQKPEGAARSLRAMNILLTASQEAQIKSAMRLGDVSAAQAVILEAVAKVAGGAAKTAGDSFQGTLNRLHTATENVSEALGEGLAPSLTRVAEGLEDVASQQAALEFFRNLGAAIGVVVELVAKLGGGIAGYGAHASRLLHVTQGTASTTEIQAELDRVNREIEELSKPGHITLTANPNEIAREQQLTALKREQLGYVMAYADAESREGQISRANAKTEAERAAAAAKSNAERESALAAQERHDAQALLAGKEAEKAKDRLESQLQQLAAIEIKVRDTEAETLAIRRQAEAIKLPIAEQIALNRQLEIERRIREESKALRAILADPRAPAEARDEAARRLKEIEAATLGLVAAEEALAASTAVEDLERRAEVAARMATAYLDGEDAVRRALIATEREDAARETALATGNDAVALEKLRIAQEREAEALANERLGTMDRQTAAIRDHTGVLRLGSAATVEATRQEEFRARVLEQMEGLEDKYRAAIEGRVRAQMRAEDVDDFAAQVQAMQDQLTLEIRVSGLSEMPAALRTVEENWLRFLANLGGGTVEAGEALFADMAAALGKTVEELKATFASLQLTGAMAEQRGASVSRLDLMRADLANERAIAQARLDVGDEVVAVTRDLAERERQIKFDHLNGVLSDAQAVLGQLADRFGGFFTYLQQGVAALQQARSAYGSWSDLATGLGAGGGTAAAFGAVGAYIAIAGAVLDEYERHRDSRRARQYDMGASFSFGGYGFNFSSNTDAQARELAQQVAATAEAFVDAIGGAIDSFAALGLQVRQDGKYWRAIVAGELVGQFESMQEAVSAALLAAFADPSTVVSGLSDLVRLGLEQALDETNVDWFGASLGEVQDWLSALREITELNFTQGAQQLRASVDRFDELREAVARLNVETAATTQALNDINAAEAQAWQSWRDSIEGRERSAAEMLRLKQQEGELYNAQRELRMAELELEKVDLQGRLAAAQARGDIAAGEALIRQRELEGQHQFLAAKAQLAQAELSLGALEVAAIAARIAAIDRFLGILREQGPIDIGGIRLPGAGGGRRQQLADLEDELREVEARGLSELARQAQETREEIERLTAEANRLGADASLTAAAIAQLRQELADNIRGMVRGSFPASEWDARAAEIRQRWDDVLAVVQQHLAETGEQLVEFWEIQEAMAREVAALAEDMIGSLGLPAERSAAEMARLEEVLNNLYAAMVGGFLPAERFGQVLEQLREQIFGGLLGGMAQYITDERERAAVEAELRETAYDAQKLQWALEIEHYESMGLLTEAQADRLRAILAGLADDLPAGGGGGGGFEGGGGGGTTEDPLEEARRFLERLRELDRNDRQGLNAERDRARETYEEMTEDARRMAWQFRQMGVDVADVLEDIAAIYQRTLLELTQQANDALRDAVHGLLFGPDSPIPLGDQITAATAEYERLRQAALGGDLDARAQLGGAFSDLYGLLSQAYGSSHGAAAELAQQFLALMAGFGIDLQGLGAGFTAPPLPLPGTPANDDRRFPPPVRSVREDMMAANRGTETRLDSILAEMRRTNERLYAAEQVQATHGRTFADIALRLSQRAA